MLKMFKGCEVPCPEKLNNEYEILGDYMLNANVDADKVEGLILDFVALHEDEPIFFFLELPPEYRSAQQVSCGQNIIGEDNETYYIDNLSPAKVKELLDIYGDILINDGISRFGFGGNFSNDQFVVDKYNVVSVFSMDLELVEALFIKQGLAKVDDIVTAWDTFSEEEPGIANRYEVKDVNVFDLPALLSEWGIYLLNIRPDE